MPEPFLLSADDVNELRFALYLATTDHRESVRSERAAKLHRLLPFNCALAVVPMDDAFVSLGSSLVKLTDQIEADCTANAVAALGDLHAVIPEAAE